MFDDFLRNCPPEDEIKPSKKRVEKNIAAVRSLIEKEENSMTKRRFYLKPLVIAAAIVAFSALTLVSVNAAMQGGIVKFFMGGKEVEGEFYDYVDGDGFRRISFGAVMPLYEQNYAIIYDVDAPHEEAVRVITDDTDREFMDKLRSLKEARDNYRDEHDAWLETNGLTNDDLLDPNSKYNADPDFYNSTKPVDPEPEDFGLVFKDSELCVYHLGYLTQYGGFSLFSGTLGGNFMHTGTAYGHPSARGSNVFEDFGEEKDESAGLFDYENETQTYKYQIYYYVGKQ